MSIIMETVTLLHSKRNISLFLLRDSVQFPVSIPRILFTVADHGKLFSKVKKR
jgi:hypothetical protein